MLWKRGKIWWVKFKVKGGERIRKSTGVERREDAERIGSEIKARYTGNAGYRQGGTIGLSDLYNLDRARALRDGQTDLVINGGIKINWFHIVEFFEKRLDVHRDPSTLTLIDLDKFEDYCINTLKNRPQTYKRYFQTLRRGLHLGADRYGYKIGIEETKWPKFKSKPKNEAQRGKGIEDGLKQQFIDMLVGEARDQAIVYSETGIRYTECERLQPSMIVRRDDPKLPGELVLPTWVCKTGKKVGHGRSIGLIPTALAALDRQIARRTPAEIKRGFIFSGKCFRKAWATANKRLGVEQPITPRDMRHTFLTILLMHGEDMKAIMATGGHVTVEAANMYQSTTDARDVAAALAYNKRPAASQPAEPKHNSRVAQGPQIGATFGAGKKVVLDGASD